MSRALPLRLFIADFDRERPVGCETINCLGKIARAAH